MNDRTNLPVAQPFQPPMVPQQFETSVSAAAAQAKAMVEARYVIALKRPRVWDQVRQDILKECKRPSFAHNKSAFYRKPIGQGVEGLGIRFTEVALRCMTNVLIETTTVFEDDQKEIVRVSVTDLEANVTYPMDVRVTKTVERSKPMDDGSYISVRQNSYNKAVYTVPANDEDLLNKRGALISKAQRTLALRLIPGDIQDEAEAIIKEVRQNEAARDPDAERKRIADAFAELNVKARDLQDYLGHPLDNCSPQELVNLRGLYGAIRDGEATWAQAMENKTEPKPPTNGTTKPTLPELSEEAFAKRLAGWRKTIEGGTKTAAEVIATIETKNTLTAAQKQAIEGKVDEPATKEDVKALLAAAEEAAITQADIVKHLVGKGYAKEEMMTVGLTTLTGLQLERARAFVANPVGASK
jgi:hypothetical protein